MARTGGVGGYLQELTTCRARQRALESREDTLTRPPVSPLSRRLASPEPEVGILSFPETGFETAECSRVAELGPCRSPLGVVRLTDAKGSSLTVLVESERPVWPAHLGRSPGLRRNDSPLREQQPGRVGARFDDPYDGARGAVTRRRPATYASGSNPFFRPYSPECPEERFCKVRSSNLRAPTPSNSEQARVFGAPGPPHAGRRHKRGRKKWQAVATCYRPTSGES
jgi:hypothetical protein